MMKRSLAISLQALVALTGICALGLMLWEPHLEGRNAQATVSEIYLNDPFLACVYIVSIAFFVALYKIFKLIGYAGQNTLSSPASVRALRTIKYCGLVLIAAIAVAEIYLVTFMRGKDDIAGGVAMGVLLALIFTIMATSAAVFEKRLQRSN